MIKIDGFYDVLYYVHDMYFILGKTIIGIRKSVLGIIVKADEDDVLSHENETKPSLNAGLSVHGLLPSAVESNSDTASDHSDTASDHSDTASDHSDTGNDHSDEDGVDEVNSDDVIGDDAVSSVGPTCPSGYLVLSSFICTVFIHTSICLSIAVFSGICFRYPFAHTLASVLFGCMSMSTRLHTNRY